jgi:uncharacterized protein YerC
MAVVLRNKINKNLEKIIWERLLKETRKIRSVADLKQFICNIFTNDEKTLILRRMAIIELIGQKKKYFEIKELLGVSGDTISAAKDIILGYGYNKRDKKIKYSAWPKSKSDKKYFSKFPTYKGKGRWRFLNM